ncbi:MtrAB system accessory protein LpqB [Nocardia puris]|uniref:Lipoprotein LpqB n=1 Tax=Nocardia puris TaxID=208602 RepID=A0A366DTH0_9NOCA|nr:MtrAB system accessory protein LpqB [Nocardia puris]MBF6364600.1 MtrAB system accessory protein LpqB [Nocardia puris]MBF6459529.1 MtrAB system accessory protein LpqB [Nocardia puris]RBO92508.1 sporulation and spore germination protein [Nocardia puris]
MTMPGARTPRRFAVCATLLAALLVLGGCASLPDSSSPQALGTLNREPTTEGPPPPLPGRDPDLLLRDFLQATADPTNRHLAARQYMTPAASAQWDDSAGTLIVDKPDTLRESRSGDQATYVIRAQRVAELAPDGSYRAVEGTVENKIEMTRVDGEWRIDELPDGVVMDKTAFAKSYRRNVLYFADPSGASVVPDLRWISVPKNQLTQRLLTLLTEGSQPALAAVVRNELAAPVTLRGPITKANGDPDEVGVGLGGVRIDFAGASELAPRDRELLAAQVVLTLAAADILGPYMLLADGKPLDDRFAANGWSVADVEHFGPTAVAQNRIGLHALRDGALVQVTDSGVVNAPGYFGGVNNLRSIALSPDGQLVAAVAEAGRPAPEPPRTLMIGTYGGGAFPVAEGDTISRPSWTADGGAAWAVINGDRVIRAVNDRGTGNVSVRDVDTSALFGSPSAPALRGPITELRVSATGVRAAIIADGKVFVAVVEPRPDGRYVLTSPLPIAVLSTSAVSLNWLGGDRIIVAREGNVDPVVTVAIDGSEQVSTTSQNLTPPVRVVAASPTTQYVADSRGVLGLTSNETSELRYWTEIPGLSGSDTAPVLPG